MKTSGLLIFFLIVSNLLSANDGAFYINGGQLIPMTETTVKVEKEVLNILKKGNYFYMDVQYEFNNTGAEKTMVVGFEALPPEGDVSFKIPKNKRHPFMFDFSVEMNGDSLGYRNAIVCLDQYFQGGKFKECSSRNLEEIDDFMFVYYFEAKFKKGLNNIRHRYRVKASSGVYDKQNLLYVLKAAGRWSGGRIGDFTLNIQMGPFEPLSITQTFFHSTAGWRHFGVGSGVILNSSDSQYLLAYISEGGLTFHQKNFRPNGDLFLSYPIVSGFSEEGQYFKDTFDANLHSLPFGIHQYHPVYAKDEWSLRVMKNLPYARRGYVFKDKELLAWYKKLEWYVQNDTYIADQALLSLEEKKYLKSIVLTR